MEYAKYINSTTIERPTEAEFAGILNWRHHDAILRAHGYLPLVGEAEPREGYEAVPVLFELCENCINIIGWEYHKLPVDEAGIEEYNGLLEGYLLEVRSERGYTDREPSDYYNSTVSVWAKDAAKWVAFRDAVMLYGLDVLNRYKSEGVAPMTLDEFEQGLRAIKIDWES